LPRNHIRRSRSDFVFDVINYALLVIILILVMYPLYFILIASVSDPNYTSSGQIWFFPKGISLGGYAKLLKETRVWIGYRNTIFYTVAGTAVNLLLTLPTAYALASKRFMPRNFVMFIFIFTMFFNGGLIPTYLVVRDLRLINTVWAMILPSALSVWNLVIARTYFASSIPDEIEDAAFIDGCTNTRLFVNIILPVSKPIVAAVALFYAVGHWNTYFDALIYLSKEKYYPLQLFLREFLIQSQMTSMLGDQSNWAQRVMQTEFLKYSTVVVSTLPILVLYPFLQKYFVKGVMLGSIKG